MYYLNPSTYWIGGVLAATLPAVRVVCDPAETAVFNVPNGQTCASYAGAFVRELGVGYLTNPDYVGGSGGLGEGCGYCQFRDGTEYLATLNISPSEKWRDFGIFLVFCCTNWLLVYFFIYTVRVRGWTFGLGPLFRGLGKGVSGVLEGVKKLRRGMGMKGLKEGADAEKVQQA
jgi:ATP-binding cassette, subfamily G (WHITE), member 2, SNQ2